MNEQKKQRKPRLVVAIDVTTSYVFVTKLLEGQELPNRVVIPAPQGMNASHTVAATCHRITTLAQQVVDEVLKHGKPNLVVMTKVFWGSSYHDPSAARRSWQWGEIARLLYKEKIPTAELPLLTVMKWAGVSRASGDERGIAALERIVARQYPDLPEREGFRSSTIAVAAAGAMALPGFETPWPVTTERLTMLRGYKRPEDEAAGEERSNKAIQWPAGKRPPATLGEWYRGAEPPVAEEVSA